MKPLHLTLLFLLYFSKTGFNQVTITSAVSSASDCPNNGTITILAESATDSPLIYKITDNALLPDEQTSNVFSSLPPGDYNLLVKDIFDESATQSITVLGSYKNILFNPLATSKGVCGGSTDGAIEGNIDVLTGKAPYNWEIISPSPVTRPSQTSSEFNNLPIGTYTIKATDACGSFDTKKIEILEADITYSYKQSPRLEMTSCNEGKIKTTLLNKSYSPPYLAMIVINDGPPQLTNSIFEESKETGPSSMEITLEFKLNSISLGDKISLSLSDGCGYSLEPVIGSAQKFTFCTSNKIIIEEDCSKTIATAFRSCSKSTEEETFITDLFPPINYGVKNNSTNILESSGSVNTSLSPTEIIGLESNQDYEITYTDDCGNSYKNLITTPEISPSDVPEKLISEHKIARSDCLYGTSSITVSTKGFTQEPSLVIKDGPLKYEDPRPDSNYAFDYLYPKKMITGGGSPSNRYYTIGSLIPGTYKYTLGNNCDGYIDSSFTIGEDLLAEFPHETTVLQNCDGTSSIIYTSNDASGELELSGISYSNKFKYRNSAQVRDTFKNLNPNTYQLKYTRYTYEGTVTSATVLCSSVYEEVEIIDYQTPKINSYNQVLCDENIYLAITPESSVGVPPYEYELIAGPLIKPRQVSNIFEIGTSGSYTVRVSDECGNGSVTEVSLTNIEFEPLITEINCKDVEISYPLSEYYTYQWTRPDLSTFDGETLKIPNISTTEEGIYKVSQTISISSCQTTLTTNHNITAQARSFLFDTICPQSTSIFSGNLLTESGKYYDTLTSVFGCDSIVEFNLFVKAYKESALDTSFCPGGALTLHGKVYEKEGIYQDTLPSIDCDSIIKINLTKNPYPFSSSEHLICKEGKINIEGSIYDSPGVFYDTISDGSCDSVIELEIVEVDFLTSIKNYYICQGDSLLVDGNYYKSNQKTTDTLPTATCDSIAISNIIIVDPPPFQLNNKSYTTCENELTELNIDPIYSRYEWIDLSNNSIISTNPNFTPKTKGIYVAFAYDDYDCMVSDKIELTKIFAKPELSTNINDTICQKESYQLTNISQSDTVHWIPDKFDTGNGSIVLEESQNFKLYIKDIHSCVSDTIEKRISVLPSPFLEISSTKQRVLLGETTTIDIETDGQYIEIMDHQAIYNGPPLDQVSLQPSKNSLIKAIAKNKSCNSADSLLIEIVDLIEVPSMITPNNDGLNDYWVIPDIEKFPEAKVLLYNRWGNIVYETVNYDNTFDGTFNEKNLPQACYYYIINLNFNKTIYKGVLTIMR